MKDNPTTGADFGTDEFMSTKSDVSEKTKSVNNDGGDMHGIRFIPGLIQSLEAHFSFSVLLVSVIGYIVISSFGQMNSLWKFFGYLFFLIILMSFYKLLEIKDVIKKVNKFFLTGFLLFLLIIIFYLLVHFYKSYLISGLSTLINFFNKF